MSDTLHDFPFSVDNGHYLPNVTNEIKPTIAEQYLIWCRHLTQAVPQCPISAHFVTIYFLHSISSSTKCNHIIFFNSVKFLFMVGMKFFHFCSSPVVLVVVVIVVAVVVIVFCCCCVGGGGNGCCDGGGVGRGGRGGCGVGGGCGHGGCTNSSTTELSFLLYLNLLLCNLEL